MIISAQGEPITGVADLQRLLVSDYIDRCLTLGIVQAGELREIEIIPTELES